MGIEAKNLIPEEYLLLDKGETVPCPYDNCDGSVRKIVYEKKCKELGGGELVEYCCDKNPLTHKFQKNSGD